MAEARLGAQRAAVQGALAPVQKDQWREQAQPKDVAQVHALAGGWKDRDPTALAAAERIRYEVQRRYGMIPATSGRMARIWNRASKRSARSSPAALL